MFKISSLLLLASVLCCSFCNAKDVTGRFGIGTGIFHIDTEEAAPGVDFRYWASPAMGFQVTLAYFSESADKDASIHYNKKTESNLSFDGQFLLSPSKGERVNLNLILSGGVTFRNNLEHYDGHDRTDFRVMAGFTPEVFIR